MTPNLLLVVMDTARADAFEPYGAPPGSTPAVADLGSSGIVVPAAYATSNWTLPSHASMFTGLLPGTLGLGASAAPVAALRPHADRMMASVVRSAGYDTRAISANVWVSERNGFAAGFDVFAEVGGRRKHQTREGVRGRMRWAWDAARAHIDDGLTEAWSLIRSWIAGKDARPFFWFVNLMECHSPYLPPRPYNDLGLRERIRAGDDARIYQSHEGFVRVCLGARDVPDDSLERMRHLYAGAVRSMDDWLARVLDTLASRRLLDDTLVVVTSDHGENLGEGHLLGHALSLDERLIRVPLVLAGPGARAPDETPFSLAGLPELLAGIMSIADAPWHGDDLPRGAAVAQNDGFSGMSPEGVRSLARAWRLSAPSVSRLLARMDCATDGRFKLVRSGGEERVYDLTYDPLEQRALERPDQAIVTRLRAALAPADAARRVAGSDTDASESAEIEDRLRLLGYL